MVSGANIATGINDGAAHVMHWEQTNNELAKIQQRDITNQQYIRSHFEKMNMQLGEGAAGIRPADIPEFMKGVKDFREAGVMLQSSKVAKDPQLRAYWQGKLDDAYYTNMNLASQSKQQTAFDAEIFKGALNNPGAYKDFDDLQGAMKASSTLNIHEIRKTGFNTPLPFLHTPDTYKESNDLSKSILGDEKEITKQDPVHDKTGAVVGWNEKAYGVYNRPVSLVASEAARSMGNRNYAKSAQLEWQNTDPEQRQQRISEAQKIIDSDPNSKGQKIPTDYSGLYMAKWIINANQQKDMGDKGFKVNPEWQAANRLKGEKELKALGFEYGMRLAEARKQLSLQLFKEKQASKQTSSLEAGNKFYQLMQSDAYNHPVVGKKDEFSKPTGTLGWVPEGDEIQYKMNLDAQTKKIFAIPDRTTGKNVYPDEVRLLQNGDVLPVFYKYSQDKEKGYTPFINPQTGGREIDTDKSQPVKKEQFKIRLSKSLLTGKEANQDVMNDLNNDETSYNEPSLPANAMSGLLRLVNSGSNA